MEEEKNYLRITSTAFSLELEGDPAFILETYDNVRQDVLRRLIELIRAAPVEETPTLNDSVEKLAADAGAEVPAGFSGPAARPRKDVDSAKVRAANAANYVWVYVTHEIYNKVYVIDVDSFMTSPLSRFLNGRKLRKVYIHRDYQEILGSLLETGKTLWSELTEKGRAQLAGK